ncbi:hypothetical protein pb186bvf_003932 [Paramecium bursaria]
MFSSLINRLYSIEEIIFIIYVSQINACFILFDNFIINSLFIRQFQIQYFQR